MSFNCSFIEKFHEQVLNIRLLSFGQNGEGGSEKLSHKMNVHMNEHIHFSVLYIFCIIILHRHRFHLASLLCFRVDFLNFKLISQRKDEKSACIFLWIRRLLRLFSIILFRFVQIERKIETKVASKWNNTQTYQ